LKVKELAEYNFPGIRKDQTIKEALKIMSKERRDRLLVLKKDELYGIVTEYDIFYKLSLRPAEKFMPYNLPVSSCATTNVETVHENVDIKTAAKIFLLRGFSSLPVVTHKRPIGLLTKRHIISYYVNKFSDDKTVVEDIMVKPRSSVDLFSKVTMAEMKMKNTGYGTLVVVYKNRFIGLITAKELARVYFVIRKTSLRSSFDQYIRKVVIADIVDRNVYTLSPSDHLIEAAKIISKTRQNLVPILDKDEKVLGVVSRRDIIKYLLEKNMI